MYPNEYLLGPLVINGYGLMIALGVILGFLIQGLTAPLAGIPARVTRDISFWLLVAGLLGSRLFYVAFHWSYYGGRPIAEMVDYLGGGLMFQGGLLSALPVAWLLSRANGQGFLGLGDALAPSLALGQGLGRVGCFLAGCCHGRAAPPGFPLALTFPPGGEAPAGIPLYPTQLAESLGLLALAAFLVKRLKGGAFLRGGILGLYLAGTGLLRFVVDFFRGDDRGPAFLGLSPTSYLALGLFLFGLFLCRAPRRGRGAA